MWYSKEKEKKRKNVIFYITIKGSGKLPVSLRTVFMVSMCVCAPQACLVPEKVIEGPDSLGLEAQGPYCEGWKLNQGPLQDQQVLLAAAPSLQPLSWF